jgi:hypothetical protein
VEREVPVQLVAPVDGLIVQLLGPALVPGVAIENPVQSAVVQYTAPGTCRAVGTDTVSKVFAMFPAIVELPHGAVGGLTALPHGVPSAGPPASYTT